MTADQIEASFATAWSKAQYIQTVKDYYTSKHPNWSAYVASLAVGVTRFTLAEVKPCAALYRETGDTSYSAAIRAILIGLTSTNASPVYTELDYNYSYYQIRNSTSLSAADRTLIENFISQRANALVGADKETTFVRGMMNATALAYAEILLLPNHTNAPLWRATHQANWTNNMARIMDATEDSNNYGPMWLTALYEYIRVTAPQSGVSLTNYFNQPAIKNLCERNLQTASCLGYIPSYGRGVTPPGGQMAGFFEAMATLYRDGRYKSAAQRMFSFVRKAVDSNWPGLVNDICAMPVFDYADDTVAGANVARPAVLSFDRNWQGRAFPDKLIMEAGKGAADSSVLLNFAPNYDHGHAGASAIVSFLDQGSPLLANANSSDDRVYHNLMMVRSAAEAFPFVPVSAGQLSQQYVLDNVWRRFTIPIRASAGGANGANVLDPRYVDNLTIYLGGKISDTNGTAYHLYVDNIKAAGHSGTLVLKSGTNTFMNVNAWNGIGLDGKRDLSAYDTVEFGMRIEPVGTAGAINLVLPFLGSGANGGSAKFSIADFDTCSLGKATVTESFAKLQYAATLMSLKDTLGGDNIQKRDLMLVPGGVLFVRDQVTFPAGETNVQMGPLWHAARILSSGSNWYDLQQTKVANLPQRNLLAYFPGRTDSGFVFSNGRAQYPTGTNQVVYQQWNGTAAAGCTRTFNSLLMGHATATSASSVAATVQTLQCDETATVLQVGANYLVINPDGAALNVGGLQTDAQSLYLETSGSNVIYYAGTQGSSVIYSNVTVYAQSPRQPRFGSTAPVLKVPTNRILYVPGTNGTVVNFDAEALDNNDGYLTPFCAPPSGSMFPLGTTTVHCSATNSMGISASASFTVTVLSTLVLPPWVSQDIGVVNLTGSATYYSGLFQLTGAGADIYGTTDAFQFVYQPITGDCDIRALVTSIQNSDNWGKTGVMIREALSPNSANVLMCLTAASGSEWQYRTAIGTSTSFVIGSSANRAPYWVRATRAGNVFTGYRSTNGVDWVQVGSSQTMPMASHGYIGLAVTSHNASFLNVSTIDQVVIIPNPSPTNFSYSVNRDGIRLTWPGDYKGWIAQSNCVDLSDPTLWFDIPGSAAGTNLDIPINPKSINVFYRLRHP